MPAYLGPPQGAWIPRPESAFRPLRAWLPYDAGARFREFVRGDHAPITGTAAWGAGSYGRCFLGDGSSYGVSGTFASTDALSVTVAHISGSASFRGLVGWGANFQGILYSGSRVALIDSGTAERFSANLSTPTTAWRVVTLTLAGHAIGSAGEFWADGARISSGTISSAAGTLSPAAQFWIGAVRGGTNPWQAGIGPVYLHDRILSAKEIGLLHADPWRILRDFRDDTPRRFYSIAPPFNFSGAGTSGTPAGSGALGFAFPVQGAGAAASPAGAGTLAFGWSIAAAGAAGAPAGAGTLGASLVIAGAGTSGSPVGAGAFDWPAAIAGAGVAAAPAGSGILDWEPPPPRSDPLFLGLDLTDRIEIQQEVVAKDDRKAASRAWVTLAEGVPASVQPRSLRAVPASHRREGMGTWYAIYLFPDPVGNGVRITTAHRFKFRGRILQVRSARDIAEDGELLTVEAEEVG